MGLEALAAVPRSPVSPAEFPWPSEFTVNPEVITALGRHAYEALSRVITPYGINASEDERFRRKFFRDTLIIANFIFAADRDEPHDRVWNDTKSSVLDLWQYQKKNGKLLHEVRPFDPEKNETGFYEQVGEDMINEDSVDSTPLALIVTPDFIETQEEFEYLLPKAVKALDWIANNMDEHNGWLSYDYRENGLHHQGWMDSELAVTDENGKLPKYPIALVEVQAYAWKAMRMWSDILRDRDPAKSQNLADRANKLKKRFNGQFTKYDDKGTYFVQALDGNGGQIGKVTINPGLALWANYKGETIIDKDHISSVVSRLMNPGMFDETAGVRTFEAGQPVHDQKYYHNGLNVFWPFATALVAKGMQELGYADGARRALVANLIPIMHFRSFIEQFNKNGTYTVFCGEDGECRNQTWTMAAVLWSVDYLISHPEIAEA